MLNFIFCFCLLYLIFLDYQDILDSFDTIEMFFILIYFVVSYFKKCWTKMIFCDSLIHCRIVPMVKID